MKKKSRYSFHLLIIFYLFSAHVLTPSSLFSRDANERASISVDEIVEKKAKNSQKKTKGPEKFNKAVTLDSTVEYELIKGISQTLGFLKKTANGMRKRSSARLNILTRILNLRLEQASYESVQEQKKC